MNTWHRAKVLGGWLSATRKEVRWRLRWEPPLLYLCPGVQYGFISCGCDNLFRWTIQVVVITYSGGLQS